MTFAEQQRRAHLERQHRLGMVPPPLRPPLVRAPPLVPQADPAASPGQVRTVAALQQEVAQLSARLEEMMREDLSPLVMPRRVRPVVSAVAKYYRVSIIDLVSCRRTKELLRPRHVAMYLARQLTRYSLPQIGLVFDRDHTTILHGCRKIAELRRQDPELDAEIRALTDRLVLGEELGGVTRNKPEIA